MKVIEKKKLSPTALALVILSAVLVVLIIAAIIISSVVNALNTTERELPDIREDIGEALYVGQPIAYDRLREVEILSLYVENEYGAFDMARWPNNNGEFWFGYRDNDGSEHMLQYLPPILDAEADFDYEQLYASEEADGYGTMYMLSYLCNAIGTPYFTTRIDLPTGEDEESKARRAELLKEYGFDSENVNRVSFAWGKRDSKNNIIEEGYHHVIIGGKALSGLGRYYRVDGRDCIYYSGSDQLDYAMMGFHAFVKGSLVAAGLASDSSYEPMLTTDFKHWINKKVTEGEVLAGSHVVAKADVITPIKESAQFSPQDYPDGLQMMLKQDVDFDLAKLKDNPNYKRMVNALVGKSVGECDDLFITMLNSLGESEDMTITFGDKEALKYVYNITSIDAVITEDNEYHDYGARVIDGSLVAVTYSYSVDGEAKNTVPRRALIDLLSERIPDATKEALLSSTVGTLTSPIVCEITYTPDNTFCNFEEVVVEDIFSVYDKEGKEIDKVDENSYVALRYYKNVNGEKGDLTAMTVYMPDLKKNDRWKPLYDILLGKSKGGSISAVAYRNNYYYEELLTYSTLEITEIEMFIVSELIVSFRFDNASDRDPFYGESIYENTMTNKYKLYGINSDVCHEIIKRLGGINDVSGESSGLSGKTVAIGLDHATMEKYNLYDYTVYFELPRHIMDKDDTATDGAADYTWAYVLGFTLHVSKPDPVTGKRYVGSDMYDLVAEVDAELFDFVDKSFSEYWARKNMMMIDIADIEKFDIELNMTDAYGKYDFEIKRDKVYIGFYNGVFGVYQNPFEGSSEQEKYYVNVTEGEGSMHTVLSDLVAKYGSNKVSSTKIYDTTLGGENLMVPGSYTETLGVAYMMSAYEVMLNTTYLGTLTAEEQAAAFATEKLMTIRVKLMGDNASGFTYVYDFYRASDRKVMVALYQVYSDGTVASSVVSDYYISTPAFKKMVGAYVDFLNGKVIDGEVPYPDEK